MQELNQRVHDLVRFMRQELHQEGLITDEEYAVLAQDHGAVVRLEDYDAVVQKAKEAAASKRPSGLVQVLINEIVDLNKSLKVLQREFIMYREAWIREIGGITVRKHYDIDALVLSTRYKLSAGRSQGETK